MNKCKIEVWQFVPEPEDDEPCFNTYLFAGTHDGQPFIIKVSMEIDGRDAEMEHIHGVTMRWDGDTDAERARWDDLMEAMEENVSLREDMERRSTEQNA